MIVRFILVETTLPVRIRPRIEMSPVNGHFLSVICGEFPSVNPDNSSCIHYERTDIRAIDGFRRGLESETNILVPPFLLGHSLLSN